MREKERERERERDLNSGLRYKIQSSLLNNAVLFLIVATLIAVKPSPDPREWVFESMTRDLAKISDWWSLFMGYESEPKQNPKYDCK